MKKQVLVHLIRFFSFTLVSLLIASFGILAETYRPNRYLYDNNSFNWKYVLDIDPEEYNVILDQHSHTNYSDGKIILEYNILWHIAHGFNAMFLTDHNTIANAGELQSLAQKYQDEIIIMQGMEWTTDRVHMNLLGITAFVPIPEGTITDEVIQAAINETHEQGGVVVVNHIPWSLERKPNHPSRAELLSWGVDYIEIVNENIYDYESDAWCNNTGGFGKITGTDMHKPMNVYGWTLLKTRNFTAEGIMEQLLIRNTSILFDEIGSLDHSINVPTIGYHILEPLILLGRFFINYQITPASLNWVSFGIFIGYIFGGYLLIEFSFFIVEKYKVKRKKKE